MSGHPKKNKLDSTLGSNLAACHQHPVTMCRFITPNPYPSQCGQAVATAAATDQDCTQFKYSSAMFPIEGAGCWSSASMQHPAILVGARAHVVSLHVSILLAQVLSTYPMVELQTQRASRHALRDHLHNAFTWRALRSSSKNHGRATPSTRLLWTYRAL